MTTFGNDVRDSERLEGDVELSEFIDSLARHGVDETVIAEAMAEVNAGADPVTTPGLFAHYNVTFELHPP